MFQEFKSTSDLLCFGHVSSLDHTSTSGSDFLMGYSSQIWITDFFTVDCFPSWKNNHKHKELYRFYTKKPSIPTFGLQILLLSWLSHSLSPPLGHTGTKRHDQVASLLTLNLINCLLSFPDTSGQPHLCYTKFFSTRSSVRLISLQLTLPCAHWKSSPRLLYPQWMGTSAVCPCQPQPSFWLNI